MMKKALPFLILVACTLMGYSQDLNPSGFGGGEAIGMKSMTQYFAPGTAPSEIMAPSRASAEGTTINGSPFWSDLFREGEIVVKSKDPLQPSQALKTQIRFNTYDNEFEFIHENDTFYVGQPQVVEKIEIESTEFIYTLCAPRESYIESAFMEVLTTGAVKLLKRHKCEIEQNISVPFYMGGNGDGSWFYKTNVDYYLKRGESNAIKLPYSTAQTAKLFGDNSDKAKQKIKSDKLKIRKNEEDLIELFNYMNSIN